MRDETTEAGTVQFLWPAEE
jgi:dolichol-phosphate mannosyltransferase